MIQISKRFIICISVLVFAFGCTNSKTDSSSEAENEIPKLLLISFDGFSHNYLQKTETPNFDELIEKGVASEGLIPIFPTKTFPNHYSVATGLYPENSGFIGNSMYDPEIGKFSMGNRDAVENPDWYGGEPIWNTAEKQGVKAGTMFWVGSEAPIQNMRPTHWLRYDGSISDSARVDSVMKWFTSGDDQEVDFATLYFSFVDTQGHRHGPESPQVITAIQKADALIGYLQFRIKTHNLDDKINIVIVSDHGMAEVSRDRIIVLDDMINPDDLDIIEGSPSLMANVKNGKTEELYAALKQNEKHFRVYKREHLPDRFHLKNHPRVPELILIADLGYTINTRKYFEDRPEYPSGAAHGFDNSEKEMHGIFIGNGPGFKQGKIFPAFEVVQIYNLLAHLLHIEPAPNDGDFTQLSDILNCI